MSAAESAVCSSSACAAACAYGTARADRDDAVLRLENVARTRDHERRAPVGDREHGLETPQDAIRAPVLGELDGRPRQVPLVLVELPLEALEQRERIGGRSGEAREDAVVVQATHLARGRLDDDAAERHLPVAAKRDRAVAAHRKYRGAVEGFHVVAGGRPALSSVSGSRPRGFPDQAAR